jgi:guanosine-3',5'-bis(diphosphate) 3'-pyrophosphohydrolase
VEIITAPGARPNAAWLNFVVSSKARAKIRQLLKNLKRDDSVSLGRRLLNHALGGSRKLAEIPPENIQRELDRMKLASLDDLLAEIGLGNAMSVVVAKNLQQGEAAAAPCRLRPRSSADQRRGWRADHLRQMLPSDSRRPDYRPRQPGQRAGYPP